jgi:ATPase subunit of ABC transporter with duplicated ATPase domains
MKYTSDEMLHRMEDLSSGQQAKLFFLKMNLESCDVLLLDEPTRNFSSLSSPVIRHVLKEFHGCIISVSHDRKYIEEVAETVYVLSETGFVKK